ncbi:PIH1 domain-containing protein 2 [Nothoprocta perdicaria]|uniref:PIH1 domain-containing protein 2 n=1 Tax=Nothoprocta perdicaria TaxID=30464 RepID=UPI000E1C1CE4|nr:PIH1 domain-containing protein 2 [Nothoprocta perdicaria]
MAMAMAAARSLRAAGGPGSSSSSSLALLPRRSFCFLERYSDIDVAYIAAVLQRAEKDREEMEHLIRLTLKFLAERCGPALPPSYTPETFKLKGSLERLQQSLTGERGAAAPLSQSPSRGMRLLASLFSSSSSPNLLNPPLSYPNPCPIRKPDTAKNLDVFFYFGLCAKELSLAELLRGTEVKDCSREPVLLQDSLKQSNPPLIEEISCPEVPEELSTPVYEMLTVKDANKKPQTIELKIELPKVSSVSECDLSISKERKQKDDTIIEISGKYKLELHLPQLVDKETTTAVFSKGKRTL